MKPLDDIIIDKTIYNMQKSISLQNNLKKVNNFTDDFIVTPFSYYFPIKNICPTLTTQSHCYYHKKYKRNLTPQECLLLQGFSKDFKQVVSNTQIYKQIGNSMSVNVLKYIFKEIIKTSLLKEIITCN